MCLTHNVGHVGHVTQLTLVEKIEIICIDISEKFVERVKIEILDKKILCAFKIKKKNSMIFQIYMCTLQKLAPLILSFIESRISP